MEFWWETERRRETEFGVMKQQCHGMIYERLSPSLSLHRNAVCLNITFQKNPILSTYKVISVPFQEIGSRCLFNMVFQAIHDMSAIFPHNSRTMHIWVNVWGRLQSLAKKHLWRIWGFFLSPPIMELGNSFVYRLWRSQSQGRCTSWQFTGNKTK